jgi:hypothetical protein
MTVSDFDKPFLDKVSVMNQVNRSDMCRDLQSEILMDSPLLLIPPRIRPFDEPERLPERSNFTMSSGIAQTRGGRLWVSWFGGEDGQKAYMMLASSDDDGTTWTPPRYIIKEPLTPHGFHRAILGGNLWVDPDGRMWCFFTYNIGYFDGRGGVWCSVCDNPEADTLNWTTPRRIYDGFVLNKPIIMSNGEWLLPTSLWNRCQIGLGYGDPIINTLDLYPELDAYRMANFLVSSDHGQTWERCGGTRAEEREFDEPVLIEKCNHQLLCLLRTHYGLAESWSNDFGRSWTYPRPSAIKHTSARIFTLRLASGKLLLVKHGGIDERTGRTNLTAYLSDDDGEHWHDRLLLDERDGISYPDGFQGSDGRIYIAYDRKRIDGEILLAIFSEEDIVKGLPLCESTRLKIPVQQTAKRHPPECWR